jgi:hypothetical protein
VTPAVATGCIVGAVTPTRYELRILGRLSPDVRADFAGFDVSEAPVETVLLGDVVDRAHLQGVLARLHAFGLRVLELRPLPEVPDGPDGPDGPTA